MGDFEVQITIIKHVHMRTMNLGSGVEEGRELMKTELKLTLIFQTSTSMR